MQAILYRVVRRWRYREKIGESGMSFDSNDSGAEIDEFFVDVEVNLLNPGSGCSTRFM